MGILSHMTSQTKRDILHSLGSSRPKGEILFNRIMKTQKHRFFIPLRSMRNDELLPVRAIFLNINNEFFSSYRLVSYLRCETYGIPHRRYGMRVCYLKSVQIEKVFLEGATLSELWGSVQLTSTSLEKSWSNHRLKVPEDGMYWPICSITLNPSSSS